VNARKPIVLVVLVIVFVALVGCDEKKEQLRSATTSDAGAPIATTTIAPSASQPAAPPATSTSADASDVKRFDPKHKCPTGQTHFYLEGDFCRRRCFTNADCAKKERCSPIEYPYIVDGGPGGTGKFCEGT
jgi:hypothetical protein